MPKACFVLRLQISSAVLILDRKRCVNRNEYPFVGFLTQYNPRGNDFYSLAKLSKVHGFSLSPYSFYKMRGVCLFCLKQTGSFFTWSWIAFSWIFFFMVLIKTNVCIVIVVPKAALWNYNSNASKPSAKLPLASTDENPKLKLVQTLS